MRKNKISFSFVVGFSRALDLNGTKRWPNIANDKKADREAIRRDWCHVGETIRGESNRYSSARG